MEDYLGKIRRDSDGNIVGAEATTMTWFLEVDGDEVTDLPSVSDAVCVHVYSMKLALFYRYVFCILVQFFLFSTLVRA